MEIPLLRDIVIIFALAIAVLFLCLRLRMPIILGFMLTGILAGPHGLRLVGAVREVETLAEIGVVLLLFTIGVEFSLKKLLQIKRFVLLGGSLQVVLTLFLSFILLRQLGLEPGESVFIGFLVSLSSTAIVLKILQEKAQIDSPHGRLALAILIFQDLIVVPMVLFAPFLAGASARTEGSLMIFVLKGMGIILLAAVCAKWVVPQLLYQIARTRSRELFLLTVLVICFLVAGLTYSLGLSLALGAFLAGLIVSESEYGHQSIYNILPFRDVFTSLFFVSIGMLLDLKFLFQHPATVLLAALTVVVLKSLLAGLPVSFLGFSLPTAFLVGMGLGQIGEFSFILSNTGLQYGLLRPEVYQTFLAVAVLTMGATPFIMDSAPAAAGVALRLPLPQKLKRGFSPVLETGGAQQQELRDHLVIVGFGLNGRNVAQAAKMASILYVVIEMNPETVEKERASGVPIHYGDATFEAVLEQARIAHARVMAVAVSDPVALRRIVSNARGMNPKLHIIARTRFLQEMAPLHELGANEVVPEEFETSVEIFTRVLAKYLIPKNEIERFISEVRAGGYQMLRSISPDAAPLCDLAQILPDVDVSSLRLCEDSPLAGRSIAEVGLRTKFGVTILAIRRDTQILSNPDASTRLLPNDILIVLGQPSKLAEIASLTRPPEREASE